MSLPTELGLRRHLMFEFMRDGRGPPAIRLTEKNTQA